MIETSFISSPSSSSIFVCLFDFHFSDFYSFYLNRIVNNSTVFLVLVYAFNLKFDGKLVESLLFSLFLNIVLIYIIYDICMYVCMCVQWSASPWCILFNKMNYLLF